MAENNGKQFTLDTFDPKIFGTDLDWTPASNRMKDPTSGDLVVGYTGDLGTVSGVDLVMQSRVRELTTPVGYYAQIVEDIDGVKVMDTDYGNPAYTFLSEPVNDLPLDRIVAACEYVMMKDPRVKETTVRPNVDASSGILMLQIEFALIDGSNGRFNLSLNN